MAKLLAIEGLDGSGKETQTKLLRDSLISKGFTTDSISFPRYGQASAVLVEEYLHGAFGTNPEAVKAYGASSFFAVDRFASYLREWKSTFEACDFFIADRYTTSNAIHQCSKLPREEWIPFLDWLFDYEYTKLGLPQPDKVFYLHIGVDDSQKLLNARYDNDEFKKDIHEHSVAYLRKSQVAAEFCCNYCKWTTVECMDAEGIRSIDDIHAEILESLGL